MSDKLQFDPVELSHLELGTIKDMKMDRGFGFVHSMNNEKVFCHFSHFKKSVRMDFHNKINPNGRHIIFVIGELHCKRQAIMVVDLRDVNEDTLMEVLTNSLMQMDKFSNSVMRTIELLKACEDKLTMGELSICGREIVQKALVRHPELAFRLPQLFKKLLGHETVDQALFLYHESQARIAEEKRIVEEKKEYERIRLSEIRKQELILQQQEQLRLAEIRRLELIRQELEARRKNEKLMAEEKQLHLQFLITTCVKDLTHANETWESISGKGKTIKDCWIPLLREDWSAIREILKQYKIESFHHFTDESNLESIRTCGGLYSWTTLEKNAISIPRSNSSELSHQLDRRANLQDYARASFISKPPMYYQCLREGRIKTPRFLKIKPEILYMKNTIFCYGNGASNGKVLYDNAKGLEKILHDLNRDRICSAPVFQSEILIPKWIPLAFIELVPSPPPTTNPILIQSLPRLNIHNFPAQRTRFPANHAT